MLITDIPPMENELRKAVAIETMAKGRSCIKEGSSEFYFRLTNTDFEIPYIQYLYKVSDIVTLNNRTIDSQFDVISIANEIYKNAKPLEGIELSILNKTFTRLLSKTPTKI